jgi:seryl-tRNA synthetase
VYRPKDLREQAESIRKNLKKRGSSTEVLNRALETDEERRNVIEEVESLRERRNEASEKIGELKREGHDEEADELIEEMSELKESIESLSQERDNPDRLFSRRPRSDDELEDCLLRIPNVLDETVPPGADESDNRIEATHGDPPEFSFDPEPHWDLAEENELASFEDAEKISGARFAVHHGEGARLERALINFMLDVQTDENGYEETMTPYLVRSETMQGTGQLPKFEKDMYRTEKDGLYLIPTSEVSLINLYADRIVDSDDLPVRKTAWTACFRREAGAHGKDTRGLMRQHQFNKIELIQVTQPENSDDALEELLEDARTILERLELPHRVVTLCAGDTGFAATRTYDLEVWVPSQDRYREISSCSNCRGFQARRAGIQYRPEPEAESRYCHTLNGSGIAVGRCWLALLENFQNADGSITIPDALRPYLDGRSTLNGA